MVVALRLWHLRRNDDVVFLVCLRHSIKKVEHSDHKLPGRVLSSVKLHIELDVFGLSAISSGIAAATLGFCSGLSLVVNYVHLLLQETQGESCKYMASSLFSVEWTVSLTPNFSLV